MTEQARRHHALVIGIDDYRDGPTPLVGCVNDARRMRDLLIDRHGVADDALTLLLDADASQANIRAALRDLEAHVGPDEGVIVFFAGHGGRYRGPRQVPEVLPDAEGIEVLETLVPADSGRGRAFH